MTDRTADKGHTPADQGGHTQGDEGGLTPKEAIEVTGHVAEGVLAAMEIPWVKEKVTTIAGETAATTAGETAAAIVGALAIEGLVAAITLTDPPPPSPWSDLEIGGYCPSDMSDRDLPDRMATGPGLSTDGNDPGGSDGFTPADQGGFTPADQGGFTPADQGGFTPADQGGFTPAEQGGFTPAEQGGFTPAEQGGFTPAEQGGFTPAEQGGSTAAGVDPHAADTGADGSHGS
jgi:hypothetical protein